MTSAIGKKLDSSKSVIKNQDTQKEGSLYLRKSLAPAEITRAKSKRLKRTGASNNDREAG